MCAAIALCRPPLIFPDAIATLKAMVIAAQAARLEAEAKARNMEAKVRARELLIEQMKFTIKKLRHEQFGQSSERHAMLEQLDSRLPRWKRMPRKRKRQHRSQ